jgi:Domain of unknown function (DUF6438)
MMIRFQHFPIVLVFAVMGCKSGRIGRSEMYPIITFEKTTCLGTCPAFMFKAYPDGKVTYMGKGFVELKGEYEAKVSLEILASLKNILDEAKFFEFANVYAASIKDLPTTYIYYDDGQQNAKVTDYYGAPESLKKLEKDIEVIINAIDWQKVN